MVMVMSGQGRAEEQKVWGMKRGECKSGGEIGRMGHVSRGYIEWMYREGGYQRWGC